jgi:hypothetical protein
VAERYEIMIILRYSNRNRTVTSSMQDSNVGMNLIISLKKQNLNSQTRGFEINPRPWYFLFLHCVEALRPCVVRRANTFVGSFMTILFPLRLVLGLPRLVLVGPSLTSTSAAVLSNMASSY